MSLIQQIEQLISGQIQNFISNIAQAHSLEEEDLYKLWESSNGEAITTSAKTAKPTKPAKELGTIDMDDLSPARLSKCSKAELNALCKAHGHKCSGKKDDLISRLLGNTEPVTKTATATKATAKSKKDAENNTPVIKKLLTKQPIIAIRKNKFGNMEHSVSRLVFNQETQKVFGKQDDDGSILNLTDEDIEQCKRFKFDFEVPDNLDQNVGLDEVQITEIEDDIIIDDNSDSEVEIGDDDEEEEEEEELEE